MEKTENGYQVSRDELFEIVENGDTEGLKEILEAFNFSDASPSAPGSRIEAGHNLATTLLDFAYAKAKKTGNDPAFGSTLVRYMAMSVEIFPFLDIFNRIHESAELDDSVLPSSMRDALRENHYTRATGRQIKDLSEKQFAKLCKFAMAESSSLNMRFSVPLLTYIYEHKMLDEDSVFALMRFYLREEDELSFVRLLRDLIDDEEVED